METRLMLYLCLIGLMVCRGVVSQCIGSTCDECISSSFECAWCNYQNFTDARCGTEAQLLDRGCEVASIENPNKGKVDFIENEEVRNSDSHREAIQVKPQRVKIVTRPGYHNNFEMTFRAANNYPVDLYFLFDSSVSMKKEKENLGNLSQDIGNAIGSISTNYQMGYGVFQDKVILPFTDTVPIKLDDPCVKYRGKAETCAPPFEYKHLLSLTNDISKFTAAVLNSKSTGNIDHPEGSGDGILQSIVCKAEIGWRSAGRKLLIYASNDGFHVAGDGRLAGIVIPSDGKCHLNAEGRYDKELEMDYPSVSQLTEAAENNEVHIIFVVSEDKFALYQELSSRIPNSVAAKLSGPDSNIKDIIEKKYKEMMSEVTIIHKEVEGVQVEVTATSGKCTQKGSNICQGLEIGTNIEFNVDIVVTECPALPEDRHKTVTIYPLSMSNEKLEIDLELVCECNCSTDSLTVVPNSDFCTNGNGTLRCGVCDCNEGRFGENCECDDGSTDSVSSSCQKDGEICSGSGNCKCHKCYCNKGFSGQFCECDNTNCPLFNRRLCGGPSRGKCFCGVCQCNDGYVGSSCDCPTSNATCLYQDTMCNDAGSCECGECKCAKKGYVGKFCESCPLCGDDLCAISDYQECANCFVDSKNPAEECTLRCATVEKVELVEALSSDSPATCFLEQFDGCLSFRAEEKDKKIVLLVQGAKTCPEPVDIIPIIIGVIAGVVAVGILTLVLWKILTSVYDKLEYARFQEDVKDCKWAKEDNPVYKGATTTYKNPMLETNLPDSEPNVGDKFLE